MTVAEWDAYVMAAPTFGAQQERIEEASNAGVDFAVMLAVQRERYGTDNHACIPDANVIDLQS